VNENYLVGEAIWKGLKMQKRAENKGEIGRWVRRLENGIIGLMKVTVVNQEKPSEGQEI
jgi:hypothetical protein